MQEVFVAIAAGLLLALSVALSSPRLLHPSVYTGHTGLGRVAAVTPSVGSLPHPG